MGKTTLAMNIAQEEYRTPDSANPMKAARFSAWKCHRIADLASVSSLKAASIEKATSRVPGGCGKRIGRRIDSAMTTASRGRQIFVGRTPAACQSPPRIRARGAERERELDQSWWITCGLMRCCLVRKENRATESPKDLAISEPWPRN
jgi:hypothetical protein